MSAAEKFFPNIGDKLYLSQRTGNMYVDEVKRPYTVIAVSPKHVVVQAAKCIFPTPHYYDTMPISIEADAEGEILELNWATKKHRWQIDKYQTGYPEIAHFTEEYEYFPYLD